MKFRTGSLALVALLLPLFSGACEDAGAKKKEDKTADSDDDEKKPAKPRLSKTEKEDGKNTIAAFARGAVGAFERETETASGEFGHALCKSAQPTPMKLPEKGEKVTTAEADWGGDATTGWKCLKFIVTNPIHFQYSYIAGGPYKGKGRATDPGPDGFQICAEADVIPAGETTLYCQTGTVSAEKVVKLAVKADYFDE